ncbi:MULTISPECIES: flagellar filament capping protein FliD [Alcaligenes]|uniref:flagellar filament capping protein FliD n=1 Tax=Alcaligenes TaxID=507 RepID=UPI0002AAC4DB|nr:MULTISPECIES: flagellar filament capping protein FliD [Alcaligenes]EKU30189.1 flagellar hook-associated protein 2 [Alcaligenes sp. HPC1271]ERI35030.1 hypothetical protein N879_05780 [Alcaligenes sp. EGD-AK7]UTM01998.1 flagellar filament capping protein FliD [Alcaligenes sp. NLF5-7]HRO20874.1 flagellar filament capping protein FliD [Alcaligenes phenolicus]HRP13705.1 flagellar filament capping protein FliD [Alcaligenes phenolicus]
MATISSIGVGSQLPLNTLLDNLRKVENVQLELIQAKIDANTNRISAYGKLKSAITNVQSTAETLSKAQTYGAVKTNASSDAATVKGISHASPGHYELTIDHLASAQTLTMTAQSSRTDALGNDGTITITLANGKEHTLDLSGQDTSLQGIMKAINASPDIGVTATIINNGNTTNPYQLQLNARDTGEQSAVSKIRVQGNETLENLLSFTSENSTNDDNAPLGALSEKAATDAQFTLNGITIHSAKNVLKNTVDGLEITLNKVSADPILINVERDNDVTTKAIQDFVSAYNALNDTARNLTAYNVEQKTASALTGDSIVRRAQNSLRKAIDQNVDQGQLRSLNSIGISTDPKTGNLVINSERLNAVLAEKPAEVESFFGGATGLGARVHKAADEYVKSDGFIDNAQAGAERTNKTLDKQYLATEDRIEGKIEILRKQFQQLDVMVNQMEGISSYLTQQLSMLGNTKSGQ